MSLRIWVGDIREHLPEQLMLMTFEQNGIGGNFYNCILMEAARKQDAELGGGGYDRC